MAYGEGTEGSNVHPYEYGEFKQQLNDFYEALVTASDNIKKFVDELGTSGNIGSKALQTAFGDFVTNTNDSNAGAAQSLHSVGDYFDSVVKNLVTGNDEQISTPATSDKMFQILENTIPEVAKDGSIGISGSSVETWVDGLLNQLNTLFANLDRAITDYKEHVRDSSRFGYNLEGTEKQAASSSSSLAETLAENEETIKSLISTYVEQYREKMAQIAQQAEEGAQLP